MKLKKSLYFLDKQNNHYFTEKIGKINIHKFSTKKVTYMWF